MRIPEETVNKSAEATTATRGTIEIPEGELKQSYYIASQWQLMWRKFKKHHLARLGGSVMLVMAMLAIFAGFFSPYDIYYRHRGYEYAPPVRLRVWDNGSLHRPFVYKTDYAMNENFMEEFTEDTSQRYPLRFFHRGAEYKLLGLIGPMAEDDQFQQH